jgi:Ran GTPase-activating protein (RanGAP) involved in mRNA processing and transport
MIDISGNSIGDEGVKAVVKVNSTLRIIELSGNWIGDKGARAFAEAIKVNSTLQSIDLSSNNDNKL